MAGTARKLKITFGVLLALFLLLQLWPAGRSNPPVAGELAGPPEVKAILARCCYDCHSNETRWPWYAYVNPVAFFVVHDTDEGRRKLNFSIWESYSSVKRSSKADEMVEEIEKGSMPLGPYLWMHGDARVTPQELKVLRTWSEGLPANFDEEPR